MRIIHKGFILVGVPLLIAVGVIGAMYALILRTENDRLEEYRQRQVAEEATSVQLMIFDGAMALKTFLLQRDQRAKEAFKRDLLGLKDSQERLWHLEPRAQANPVVTDLRDLITSSLNQFKEILDLIRERRLNIDILVKMSHLQADFAQRSFAIADFSHSFTVQLMDLLERSPKREEEAFHVQTAILLAGVLSSIFSGLLLSRWFMSDITARLQVMTDNTLRLSRGDKLNPQLAGSDEIAQLDEGFHKTAESLREAMAKERALFENASDIICVLDGEFRFSAVNPACERILGYAATELIGHSCFEFMPESEVPKSKEILESTKVAKPARTLESQLVCKDGRTVDLIWSVYWSHLDAALYAVAHDISERKQIERLKQEFLGMVSHDLRSPLASIFGTFKLIAAGAFGSLPEGLKDKVDGCTTNVNRLLGLVNDLLDIEKMEAGQLELNKDSISVDKLLAQAGAEVQPLADARQIKITSDSDCGFYFLDGDRLTQVLVNLLSNAIKFSPDGGSIQLKAMRLNEGLEVQVIDEGRGVPESHKTTIFERFKQVSIEDGRRQQGTGLGLPICKQIIEQHGGSIGVENRTGGGSIFWFRLPPTSSAPAAIDLRQTFTRMAALRTVPLAEAPASSTTLPIVAGSDKQKRSDFLAPLANMRLAPKGAILVFLPVIFELVFAGSLYNVLTKAYREKQQEIKQHLIATVGSDLLLIHYAMGASMSLPKTADSWQAFDYYSKESTAREQQLASLTADDPEQSATVHRLQLILKPGHAFTEKAHAVISAKGLTPASIQLAYAGREDLEIMASQGAACMRSLVEHARHKGEESPARLDAFNRQVSLTLLGALAASLAICGASAYLFSISITQRIRLMAENITRLESGQNLHPSLRGADEVSRLDQFMHTMADALREARRKERAVFDNSQDILIELQPDGTIVRINPACQNIWGITQERLIGASLVSIVPEDQREKTQDALSNVVHSGAAALENQVSKADESRCDMLWSLSYSEDRAVIIAVAHDISQRKELERLKQEFLGMVSHDMRTPLCAIQGTAEMMVMGAFGPLPDKAQMQMTVVDRNCQRLLSLINDLLDIEKLDSGSFELDLRQTNGADILQRSVEALSAFAAQNSIQVQVDAQDSTFSADSDRLTQVAVNLLSNAIKFSPPHSAVRLCVKDCGDAVRFEVQDQGRGIPDSHLSAIFDRYRQVESSDGKRAAGTGLGLPICKRIVEQHGGTIGVESKVGAGSTFWFSIPKSKKKVAQV